MNVDEKHTLELILHYCNKIESHIEYFGDNKETYMTNEHYQVHIQYNYWNRIQNLYEKEYVEKDNEFIKEMMSM